MEAKVDQTPATNSNPVLSVDKNGCIVYSNEAGNLLLNEWGVKVGEKLPSSIVDLVKKVITQNNPEKMETKVGNRIYLAIFSPLPEQECVNISGFDISAQKDVEGKLRESENKYRNIVKTSVEGIWIFNSVSETTYVNEKMAEMLGYSPEEMIGRFIWDFAYEEDKGIFQIKLANRKQGIDEVYELKLIHKNGSPLWFSVSAKGFFDDAGKFAGSVGMFTDITEGKKVEKALLESKARIESIFRSSPVGIGVVVNRMITEANERLCEMTGYSREELLGKSALMLYPTMEEYERAGRVKYSKIRESGIGNVETLWQRKDGSVIDILLSSSPIVSRDLSGEITFTALDITERKRAEETLAFERSQLLSIFDGIDDVVYVTDPYTYEVLYANKAMKEKFGSELMGGLCYREFQRRDSPCDFCTNQIILKEKGKPYHWEYYNSVINRHLMIMDRIIKWPDGRDVRIEIAKDITERKQMEEQTRQRAEELETLMDVVPVAIFISHDPKCQNITGNRMANELYEAKLGENVSANVSNLRRIFDKGIELTAYELPMQKAAYEDIDVRNEELDWVLPSGEKRAVIGSASPLHDAEGNVRGSIGAFIDITERKQMEEALIKAYDNLEEKVKERTVELEKAYNSLKESEGSLAEAQEMAHVGNWDWDLVTDEVYWSDEMYRIFGRNPQEPLGTYTDFLNYIHPDDRKYVDDVNKRRLNGEPVDIDHRIILANGEERTVHSQAEIIFDEKNVPIRIKGIVQDITECRKAEEKIKNLANIVESSEDAIGTISLDGIITSWNKGAEKVYGYSAEEILGKHVSILSPSHLDKETMKLIKLIKQGKSYHQYESLRIGKDGNKIYVSITYSPVLDNNGKPTAISVIGRDITKRKKAEEALAKIEIARKQEIHHRIKNNLQVISSLLDLQAEQFRKREDIRDSEVIEAFQESQNRVISMALIHEELYKGGGFETLNFSPYIQELANTLFQTYRLGNADISLKTDMEENISFDMDTAVPLGMIVNEIVSNSLKHAFIGRDKGEIRIKLHREEPTKLENEGNQSTSTNFTLTISDNGVGIPENLDIESLESLGMQLVTSLVNQLDGELELRRNNGTEFTIRFTVTGKKE